jgi:hypothetical protein
MGVKGRRLFLALALAALVALALTGAASADSGGRPLSTTLTGAAEVPGPGDDDGSGVATITVNPGQEEVCWEISVVDITLPATGAHIHVGPAGEFGDVVVPLTPPDASGLSSGCEEVSRELALDILMNPENYYVNVHTTDFPDGAIRGQLS